MLSDFRSNIEFPTTACSAFFQQEDDHELIRVALPGALCWDQCVVSMHKRGRPPLDGLISVLERVRLTATLD